jgi:hypothetical protein
VFSHDVELKEENSMLNASSSLVLELNKWQKDDNNSVIDFFSTPAREQPSKTMLNKSK